MAYGLLPVVMLPIDDNNPVDVFLLSILTVLSVTLVVYIVRSLGDIAVAFGPIPVAMVTGIDVIALASNPVDVDLLYSDTVLLAPPELGTYTHLPSGEIVMPTGQLPVAIVAFTIISNGVSNPVLVSLPYSDIVYPPKLVTYANNPFGDIVILLAPLPVAIVPIDVNNPVDVLTEYSDTVLLL